VTIDSGRLAAAHVLLVATSGKGNEETFLHASLLAETAGDLVAVHPRQTDEEVAKRFGLSQD
jgi:hypothetical protein